MEICLTFSRMTVSSVWNIIYQFNNTMVISMASKLLVTFADYFLSGVFFHNYYIQQIGKT